VTLTQIEYFLGVARTLSFTEAAKLLYVTQSALSKQIALFEQEIGMPLFIRTRRNVRLTDAGMVLYEEFNGLPEHIQRAIKRAKIANSDVKGTLSIGILEGQNINVKLPETLRELSEVYPNIEISVERDSFRGLRKKLDQEKLDVIISLSFDVENLDDISFEVILQQSAGIALNAKHPLANDEFIDLERLKDEPFITISSQESPRGYEFFIDNCTQHGFTPNIAHEANNLETLLMEVESGLGIALIDRNTRLEQSSNVKFIEFTDFHSLDMVVAWQKGNPNPTISYLIHTLLKNKTMP
jgi:DNA-binding transcriptional LysR family regulator